MPKDGRKAAIALGAGVGIAGLIYAVTRPAKAVPPEQPPPGLASLYGVVTDAETGKPISGVHVSLWDTARTELIASTSTNRLGSYQITNIYPGNYIAEFSKDGYETVTY